jgi:hypothetical protein
MVIGFLVDFWGSKVWKACLLFKVGFPKLLGLSKVGLS